MNECIESTFVTGDNVSLDESMIKSFHENLPKNPEVIGKPNPIGNEIKNMADGCCKFIVKFELYEGKNMIKEIECEKIWNNICQCFMFG